MHNVLHTNSVMPSVSLIKSICYPESYRFSVEATKWGCRHEKLALDAYRVMKEKQHLNFRMVNCGSFISTDDPSIGASRDYPSIGASPDSVISRDCCGDGCVLIVYEITQLMKHHGILIQSFVSSREVSQPPTHIMPKVLYPVGKSLNHPPILCPKFCIQSGSLSTTHPYYAQSFVSSREVSQPPTHIMPKVLYPVGKSLNHPPILCPKFCIQSGSLSTTHPYYAQSFVSSREVSQPPTHIMPKVLYPVGKSLNHPPILCPKFCIQSGSLSTTHPYYAQIQTQMNVCNRKYCDFFMWTEKDYFCQRVIQDKDIWKTYDEKVELVFRNGVLPEIIGKCFTRVPKVTIYDNNDGSTATVRGESLGEIYPCSRAECQLKYFHLKCLNLTRALKKSWVCPDCRNVNITSRNLKRKVSVS